MQFAREENIHLTSYMTLVVGRVMNDAVMNDVARQRGATPAQLALAWAMQQGHSVILSSTRRENLESNLKALDLKLTEEDMARTAQPDRGERLANPPHLAPTGVEWLELSGWD